MAQDIFNSQDIAETIRSHIADDGRTLRSVAQVDKGALSRSAWGQVKLLLKRRVNMCSLADEPDCKASNAQKELHLFFGRPNTPANQPSKIGTLSKSAIENLRRMRFYEIREGKFKDVWSRSRDYEDEFFVQPLKTLCTEGRSKVGWVEGFDNWVYFEAAKNNDDQSFKHMFKCTRKLTHVGTRLQYLCAALKGQSFTLLESLEMDTLGVGFGSDGVLMLAEAIKKGSMQALTILNLRHNLIGRDGFIVGQDPLLSPIYALADAIGSLGKLEILNLQDNQIGDEGIKTFANSIGRSAGSWLPPLRELYLDDNEIGLYGNEIGMQHLCIAFQRMPFLKKLSISWNYIGTHALKHLVQAHKSLKELEVLDLSGNEISKKQTDEEEKNILRHFPEMQQLDLSKNPRNEFIIRL